MRKEIIGTILFFLVVLTLVSLLSYNIEDPSFLHAGAEGRCNNLFGPLGAYLSSLLIAMFGMGAFWIPVFLLISGVRFLGQRKKSSSFQFISGALILIITTGTFISILSQNNMVVLFGRKISSGGLTIRLKEMLLMYTNKTGSIVITLVLFSIGLILSTGFSFAGAARFCVGLYGYMKQLMARFSEWIKKRREARKEKKQKFERVQENARKNVKVEVRKRPEPEVKIKPVKVKPIKAAPVAKQEEFSFMTTEKTYDIPSTTFLQEPDKSDSSVNDESLRMQSMVLEKKLEDFGVHGHVSEIAPGPVITTFEYKPAAGVKINKIVNLSDDLALALRAVSIRIIAPIPGKDAVGIEIPNDTRESVSFKEIVTSAVYVKSKSPLTLCLGNDIVGQPVVADLAKMPHLLIAGATGAGKSVGLNVMISSILFRSTPDDVRMIMIDPKRIELSVYDGIPHLITPVVTDMKKATNALFWAVREMENRYELLAQLKTRNIGQYNKKVEQLDKEKGKPSEGDLADEDQIVHEKLPYIIIIIDELADLMMVASKDVEVSLMRLAQMARAAGIHIILATQRPSVDVLTGIIKANFPTRISFQVSSRTDSRTIIDANGAENLLGMGDMLFLPPGTAKLQRIHGAYISEDELSELIDFWKKQDGPGHDASILDSDSGESPSVDGGGDGDYDEKYDEAVALVMKTKKASISSVQRYLKIGYNRAANIIEQMEQDGLIGPQEGSKPREIFVGGSDEIP